MRADITEEDEVVEEAEEAGVEEEEDVEVEDNTVGIDLTNLIIEFNLLVMVKVEVTENIF